MGLCRSGRARPRSTTCSTTRPTTPVADTLGGNRPCTPRSRTPRSGGRTNGWLLHTRQSRRTPGRRRTRCPGSTSRLAPIGNTHRDLKGEKAIQTCTLLLGREGMFIGLFKLKPSNNLNLLQVIISQTSEGLTRSPLPHGWRSAGVSRRSAPIHAEGLGSGYRLAALGLRLGPLLSRGLLGSAQDRSHLHLAVLRELAADLLGDA